MDRPGLLWCAVDEHIRSDLQRLLRIFDEIPPFPPCGCILFRNVATTGAVAIKQRGLTLRDEDNHPYGERLADGSRTIYYVTNRTRFEDSGLLRYANKAGRLISKIQWRDYGIKQETLGISGSATRWFCAIDDLYPKLDCDGSGAMLPTGRFVVWYDVAELSYLALQVILQAPAMPDKLVKGNKLERLAIAMLQVQSHPDWSDATIAKSVGVHKSTLSRNKTYKIAAELARNSEQNLASRPRGFTKVDHETGSGRGIEAVAHQETGVSDTTGPGRSIEGSRYVVEYCAECGEPIRVPKSGVGTSPICEACKRHV